MSAISIKKIATDVATILGETLARDCSPAESPFPDLEERVETEVPGILMDLLMNCEAGEIDCLKPLNTDLSITGDSSVRIKLPEDFLRLISLKLSNWLRPVNKTTDQDSPEMIKNLSRWEGVKPGNRNPVAAVSTDGLGRCLKMAPASGSSSVEYGWYAAVPEISGTGIIEVPGALYSALIDRLVKSLK